MALGLKGFMSKSNYDPRNVMDRMRVFMQEPGEDDTDILRRIEQKLDALTAALVKPQSSIILVGDDIARIAAELKNGGRHG